jgi:polypeptide N-acetylgalactosaminyltransferase
MYNNDIIGPGEQGLGVVLSPAEVASKEKSSLYGQNGFNALVSDKISLERSLNDIRHAK